MREIQRKKSFFYLIFSALIFLGLLLVINSFNNVVSDINDIDFILLTFIAIEIIYVML